MLEDRLVLYALSTGTGDGSLNIEVDGFGAFGSVVGSTAGPATYDPIGAINASSTTFESGVAVRFGNSGPRQFLTSGFIGSSGGLPEPTPTGSTTSAVSNFSTGSLAVELTQVVAPIRDDSEVQTGSVLTQSYRMENQGSTSLQFEVIRYIDGDLFFDGTLVDGGGRIFVSGTEVLFETDAGGSGETDTTFLGIDANGGTIPSSQRFELDSYNELVTGIIAGDSLDDTVTGDTNGDGFVDPGNEYDITLALLNVFDLAPGASATYTTRTVFGSGTPEDVGLGLPEVNLEPDISVVEGDSGSTDVVFVISIADDTASPLTVVYSTADGSATATEDYNATNGTLTFEPEGPLSQTVTVQILGDTDSETDETFSLQLSDVVNGQLGDAERVVTIVNDDISASINDVAVVEHHAGTTNAVFTVSVDGFRTAPVTVSYSTGDGTANGGVDFVPTSGTLTFPLGTNTALVTVPVVGDIYNEGNETFLVSLFSQGIVRLAKGTGIGTIIDDDLLPALYVNDVQVKSTQSGTLAAVFTVALDAVSGRAVHVQYGTMDGTAQAGIDYLPQSGELVFPPFTANMQVTVPVTTSDLYSSNELFALKILNPSGAVLLDPLGICTGVFAADPPFEYILDDGSPGYSRTNGWANVTNLNGFQSDYDYHAAGNGSESAGWTVTNLAPGPYEVFARWVPFSNRASNAPYTVFDGVSSRGTVLVDQRLAPTGDLENGINWQSLGTFQISTGVLNVRLGDNANGYVIADAVRIVPNGIPDPVPEIDIAYAGDSIDDDEVLATTAEGTAFGNVLLDTDSPAHTFTITNTGNAPLHLTGTPRVQVVGDNPGEFAVLTQPAAVVAPGGSTSFAVMFHPTSDGVRQAVISVDSNDGDEGEYRFLIEGTSTDGSADAPAQNFAQPTDVNGDLAVTPLDVLVLFNAMLQQQSAAHEVTPLTAGAAVPAAAASSRPGFYLDVDGNGFLSPLDALMVINQLLRQSAGANAPASPAVASPAVQVFAIDQVIDQLDEAPVVAADTLVLPADTPAYDAVPVSAAARTLAFSDVFAEFAQADEEESKAEFDLSWE